jgi:hypothetical protein
MAINPHILLLLYDTTRWESFRAPYPSLPAVRSSNMVLHAEAHGLSEDFHCAVVGYFVYPQKRVRRRLGDRRRGAADFLSLLQKEETCFCGGCSSRRMFSVCSGDGRDGKWVFIGAVYAQCLSIFCGGRVHTQSSSMLPDCFGIQLVMFRSGEDAME